ncbi:MAG TPA: ArsR family transcriptional regulator [Thermoplasmata archaeon]|nr:ArsR family transcriptional regulator [Thermoplasmata archaeon]
MGEGVKNKLREVLKNWGFGDIEAEIFAILSTKNEMTAKEISNEAKCAYSTTINSLNILRRMGYVTRRRKERKFVYSANLDFVKIMNKETEKLSGMLRDLADEIHQIKGKCREKIKDLGVKVEKAIRYLEGKYSEEGTE